MELRGVGVELRGFWCGTERFWGLKRCGPCVELDFLLERSQFALFWQVTLCIVSTAARSSKI